MKNKFVFDSTLTCSINKKRTRTRLEAEVEAFLFVEQIKSKASIAWSDTCTEYYLQNFMKLMENTLRSLM